MGSDKNRTWRRQLRQSSVQSCQLPLDCSESRLDVFIEHDLQQSRAFTFQLAQVSFEFSGWRGLGRECG